MRIIALTSGVSYPSSRLRVRQCVPALARQGVNVQEFCPRIAQHVELPGVLGRVRRRYLFPVVALQTAANLAGRVPAVVASRGADLAWISRTFVIGLEETVRSLRCPPILDVDDAIWLTTPRGVSAAAAFAQRMAGVIAGNAYLAEWYGRYCPNVQIVPTAVDCSRFEPPPAGTNGSFTIGWMGTSGNFGQLAIVRDAVERFLRAYPDARWLLVADRSPGWWPHGSAQHEFVRWSAAQEVHLMQRMSVGLMPLEGSPWTRGKCSYKMLQSMAVGLPVLVSPVGMNVEVLAMGECGLAAHTEEEWYSAFVALKRDEALREALGRAGRCLVETHFDVPVIAARLAEVFRTWGDK